MIQNKVKFTNKDGLEVTGIIMDKIVSLETVEQEYPHPTVSGERIVCTHFVPIHFYLIDVPGDR